MQGSKTITRIVYYSLYQPEWLKWLEECQTAQPSQMHREPSTRLRYSSDNFLTKTSTHFFNPSTNIASSRKVSISWFHISPMVTMDNQKYFFRKKHSEKNPKTILRNLWQLSYMHNFSCKMCTFPVLVLCQRCVQCSNIKSLKLRD